MKALREKILSEGNVKGKDILKVDNFLNHQLDIGFLNQIGKEFKRIFKDAPINKILTIEASGIAIASITAQYFDDVPVVFAKKSKSQNLDGELYQSDVVSYTYGKNYKITVAKKFIGEGDRILIIDDFLAEGNAVRGLIDVLKQAGASVEGIGIVIQKGFQSGGNYLKSKGFRLEPLALIEEMNEGKIVFGDTGNEE